MSTPASRTVDAEVRYIPLSALRLSPLNARKTGGTNVADLVASIPVLGLLQNLTVVAGEKGQFDVVAGGRRLRAMQQLLEAGALPPQLAERVPCLLVDNGAVVEASTAENTLREAMHPADQFDAFRRMVDAGKTIVDIAAHFSVAELVVKQRLKLANVSPKLMTEYRDGKASLEQLQVLALTDDHKVQEKLWFGTKNSWERNPSELRQRLTKAEIPSSDPRVQLVGLDAYESRGGAVRRDLFDANAGGYVADPALLDKLATEKLQALVDVHKGEGWSWVEAFTKIDYAALSAYGWTPHQPNRRKLTQEEQKRLADMRERREELTRLRDALEHADIDGDEFDRRVEALDNEFDALANEAQRIEASLEEWPAAAKQDAGVLIYLERGQGLVIERGRLKPGQGKKAGATGSHGAKAAKPAKPKKPELSEAVIRRLSANRTAALQLKVAQNADVALRLLTERLVVALLFPSSSAERAVRITAENRSSALQGQIQSGMTDLAKAPARTALKALVESWAKRGLPASVQQLRGWIFKQDRNTLVDLLALCTGLSVDAVVHHHSARTADADAIAADVKLDMAQFWQPSAEAFLEHVPKAIILEAVGEACGKPDAARLEAHKRDALLADAGKLLHGKGWLPKPLRAPGYALRGANAKPAVAAPKKKPAKKAIVAKKPTKAKRK